MASPEKEKYPAFSNVEEKLFFREAGWEIPAIQWIEDQHGPPGSTEDYYRSIRRKIYLWGGPYLRTLNEHIARCNSAHERFKRSRSGDSPITLLDLINRSRAAISFEKLGSTPVVLAVSIQGIRTQASKDQRGDLLRDQPQPAKLLGELIDVAKKSRVYKQFLLNRPSNIPFWTEGAEYLTQKWIEKTTLELPKSLEGFSATQIKDRSVTQLVREEVQTLLDEGRPTLHELREVLEDHREQLNRLYYAVAKALGMKKDVSYFVKDL